MDVAPVETPRLLLRLPEANDAAPFLEIHQDPEAIERKQVVLVAPLGEIEVALRNVSRMRDHWELRGYGQWAVVEKATGDVIGCVGLHYLERWPEIDLSWIVHRARRGNGLATEACEGTLQWAWKTSTIDHVISLIASDNLPSIRIAIKIGATFERSGVHPFSGDKVDIYGIRRP
ncbi:MAG TPA: GNAT family N-acetyltransferase [Vicinamibacterales bacterium]|nr:GNAT family N-acetyltransferase [Vicinamibacterales bacterium]